MSGCYNKRMKKYILYFILFSIDSLILLGLMHIFDIGLYEIVIIMLIFFSYEGIYTQRYDFWQETKKIFKAIFYSYLLVLTILLFFKHSVDDIKSILLFFIASMFIVPISKRVIKRILYYSDFFRQKVLIKGNSQQIKQFKKEIRLNWYLGQIYSEDEYDSVIITSKDIGIDLFNKMISEYLDDKSEVYVVPYITDINFASSNILEYSNIRINALKIENKLLIEQNIWIKNSFDYILGYTIFPILLVPHLFISILIKLDSKGNIFFKQRRLGKNSTTFKCYKYRTMYENGDELLKEYLAKNPDEIKYYEKYHKYKNDPRITKIGKILRATSLDELPQIVNILRREMSFVGPRPYMIEEGEALGENQNLILKVKPGITGLWQVSGRNKLTFKQRNDLEIWYIKNWSLWFDFVIMIKTIKVVLSKVGAK